MVIIYTTQHKAWDDGWCHCFQWVIHLLKSVDTYANKSKWDMPSGGTKSRSFKKAKHMVQMPWKNVGAVKSAKAH